MYKLHTNRYTHTHTHIRPSSNATEGFQTIMNVNEPYIGPIVFGKRKIYAMSFIFHFFVRFFYS